MGFLLVFDVTNEASFLNVRNWIGEIQSNAYSEDVNLILVGNKCDLDNKRVITKLRAIEFAQQHQIDYIETSALENTNIAESVELLLDSVMSRLEEKENFPERTAPSNPPIPDRQSTSSFCCNY